MATVIVLDAGALIAYVDDTDAHHASVTAALDAAALEDWGMSALTVAEVMVRAAADEALLMELSERIADLEPIVIPIEWEDAEPLAQLRSMTRLRMPDCCVLRVAQARSAQILTTDGLLGERAKAMGIGVVDLD